MERFFGREGGRRIFKLDSLRFFFSPEKGRNLTEDRLKFYTTCFYNTLFHNIRSEKKREEKKKLALIKLILLASSRVLGILPNCINLDSVRKTKVHVSTKCLDCNEESSDHSPTINTLFCSKSRINNFVRNFV